MGDLALFYNQLVLFSLWSGISVSTLSFYFILEKLGCFFYLKIVALFWLGRGYGFYGEVELVIIFQVLVKIVKTCLHPLVSLNFTCHNFFKHDFGGHSQLIPEVILGKRVQNTAVNAQVFYIQTQKIPNFSDKLCKPVN